MSATRAERRRAARTAARGRGPRLDLAGYDMAASDIASEDDRVWFAHAVFDLILADRDGWIPPDAIRARTAAMAAGGRA